MKRNCFVRILSYDCPFPGLSWSIDWDAYILEQEFEERPDIWEIVDKVKAEGFDLEQLELKEYSPGRFNIIICCHET